MRQFPLVLGSLAVAWVTLPTAASLATAADEPPAAAMNFAVLRNGERIGTSSVRVHSSGSETVAEVSSHIQVKIAFVTVYRYDQTETERWSNGRLVAMNSQTNDNGTTHRVSAASRGDVLVVAADGRSRDVDPDLMPVSAWNAALVNKRMALDTEKGNVIPVAVTDRGEEQLVLQGRPLRAHHYSIRTSFPQEVWYDQHHRLVQVELSGSDGSKIQYQPG